MKLKDKTCEEFEGELSSGRFPPYIHYRFVYNSPQEERPRPSFMTVDLKGSNENLRLCFDIMAGACKFSTWLVCVCVCVCLCVCLCMCVCISVCVCVCVYPALSEVCVLFNAHLSPLVCALLRCMEGHYLV